MTDPQAQLAIVITSAGAIMGTLVKSDLDDGFVLRKPRAMNVASAGNGMAKISFSELIGKPVEVVFAGDVVYWHPPDQAVVQVYLESISGLKIARELPRTN